MSHKTVSCLIICNCAGPTCCPLGRLFLNAGSSQHMYQHPEAKQSCILFTFYFNFRLLSAFIILCLMERQLLTSESINKCS